MFPPLQDTIVAIIEDSVPTRKAQSFVFQQYFVISVVNRKQAQLLILEYS